MFRDRMFLIGVISIVAFLLVLMLASSVLYVVDQRELAVVLQFGEPVAQRTEPGLYFKMPFVQEVERLPSTRQLWGDKASNSMRDLPTNDDKKIELIPWAIWRIKEPAAFVQTLRTMDMAERRVEEFVRGAIRDTVPKYDLAELVRSTDRTLNTSAGLADEFASTLDKEARKKEIVKIVQGRQKILDEIRRKAKASLNTASGEGDRGIELVDVGISQIEFVESVRIRTFERWKAEREAIAAYNENEGKRLKKEIVEKAQAEAQRIEGEGQREAHMMRGDADAEIIRKYGSAIKETGEFYTFVRTLEVYKKSIGPRTRLILTTDSDLLRLLKQDPGKNLSPK